MKTGESRGNMTKEGTEMMMITGGMRGAIASETAIAIVPLIATTTAAIVDQRAKDGPVFHIEKTGARVSRVNSLNLIISHLQRP